MSDLKSIERCVGPFPILYEFGFTFQLPVRVPDGMGDDKFSHMETVADTFHVVATSDLIAQAAFETEKPAHVYTPTTPLKRLLVINALVGVSKNYGGHFAALALALGLAWGALIQPAAAYTPTVCGFTWDGVVCGAMSTNPDARVMHIEPTAGTADGLDETREQWRVRCRPTLSRPDPSTGMRRWTWAQPGCEFGPE